MGHSTVSFSKKGKLTYSEIKKAFDEQVSHDRDEYGYNQNPDSFYGASTPSQRYLGLIYSPKKASEVMDKIDYYESFCLYTVSQSVFMELYKKEFLKITKIKEKIKELNDQIVKASTENLTKLGFIGKAEVKKQIFFTTPCCQSKINVHGLSKYEYQTPTRCPICRNDHNGQFETMWREKVLGKAYAKLKVKITAKIEKLKLEITEVENSMPEVIDEEKLTKKQKEEIKTVVFADVHH